MFLKKYVLGFLILVSSLFAVNVSMAGGFKDCQDLFYSVPVYHGDSSKTVEICNSQYAVLYSDLSKTPLYSYEHSIDNATVPRHNDFRSDNRVPLQYESTNADYSHSGYDKGHLTPSGDMTNSVAQDESFYLSNIAPQASKFNQQQWRLLEASVKHKYEYVITGVLFQGSNIKSIGSGVLVPTQFYKIVATKYCSLAYVGDNVDNSVIKNVPVIYIENITKVSFNLPNKVCN
jgi:endonuclease G, mitochondrial